MSMVAFIPAPACHTPEASVAPDAVGPAMGLRAAVRLRTLAAALAHSPRSRSSSATRRRALILVALAWPPDDFCDRGMTGMTVAVPIQGSAHSGTGQSSLGRCRPDPP